MSSYQAVLYRRDEMPIRRLVSKFFYNDSLTEQSLKELIVERVSSSSEISKKNSTDSTQTSKNSRRVSVYEHYDD